MNTHNTRRTLYLLGIAITLLLAATAYLSPRFEYGSDMLARPIIPLVILLLLAGALYLVAVSHVRALFPSDKLLITVITFGLLMRAVLFMSKPILEDDFYRYLWDGAVTANLYNPYTYTPNQIMWHFDDRNPPDQLTRLASDSGPIAERINHASLGTVYPPITQAAFAIAHTISPFSLTAWKTVLLACDIGILLLLLQILRKTGLPETRILIYWWNPLLIKETYNGAHMDLIIMLFLILALYCAVHQYTLRTGLALSCAIAAKIWPLILIPLFLRFSRALRPERLNITLISAAFLALLCIPMLWAIPLGEKSGFLAYSEHWEMNDALFMIIDKLTRLATAPLNLPEPRLDTLARLIVAAALLTWIIILTRKRTPDAPDFLNRLTLAVAALFMLSPTQFPWYYLWILPLLTLTPRPSLLILTLMLPLYYLKFHYAAQDNIDFFHNTIVWIEYTPTILLLTYEAWTTKLDLSAPSNLENT